MYLIKLNATESTNSYLKELSSTKELEDFTTVMAYSQISGRGQRGVSWESEPGKNLTISVLKMYKGLDLAHIYLINMLVSLSVVTVLDDLNIPDITIKWPNDILSGNKKIAGILIENNIVGAKVTKVIIGLGLNINQKVFKSAPRAASLQMITNKEYELETVLEKIVVSLQKELSINVIQNQEKILNAYESKLYRKNLKSYFLTPQQERIAATIKGVDAIGNLKLEMEDGSHETFATKEMVLIY